MPLFSSRRRNNTSSADEVTRSNRRRGIDSRSSRSPGHAEDHSGSSRPGSHDSYRSGISRSEGTHGGGRSRGLFRRRRSLPSDRHADLSQDQTLMNARAKVSNAEAAERSADTALYAARSAVREAKDHVKTLGREVVEEYAYS
jgi:hypothetical protein